MEQMNNVPLLELSAFAESFSVAVMEKHLAESSMTPEEKTAFREQYQNMQAMLLQLRKEYEHYENVRPAIKASLEEYRLLLRQGPEARVALIQKLAAVLEQSSKIDILDDVLLDLLREIWPEVQWPEQLPAFEESDAPDESGWPRLRLKNIFEAKNRKAQEFWNNSWQLVRLDIASAIEELKKEKKHLESLGKVMGLCSKIAGLLNKIPATVA